MFFNISNDKIPCERSAFLGNNETTDKHKLRQTSNDQLNINYLGLDSFSRLVAERKMPKNDGIYTRGTGCVRHEELYKT